MFSIRSILLAEWKQGNWRLGAELYDSRAYDTDPGSVLTTGEVNAFEPVQVYAVRAFPDAFGKGTSATIQAGRFTMNLGSRRLVAADDYRNTPNGYTGVRADMTLANKMQSLFITRCRRSACRTIWLRCVTTKFTSTMRASTCSSGARSHQSPGYCRMSGR